MGYFRWNSLTFWAGLGLIVLGVVLGVHEVEPLGVYGDVLANLAGDYGGAALVMQGLGLIGLRRAVG